MELKYSSCLRDLDKTLAIAGVILSLILIAYIGRENGQVVYLLTGVLALISCLLWLAIRKNHTFEFDPPESQVPSYFWAICFFGLYTLSVLSVYHRPELYERPLLYFVLTALMASVIACEIMVSSRQHISFILIQILLLGMSIAWSQLLIFPDLLGIDPWFHSSLTGQIIKEGVIPEGYAYSKLPLFHLMIAATSLIADLLYKFATMFSVSLSQVICNAVFVFLIANYLFKNHRIGLLAALLVITANHHIYMSYWSIPNSFAAVFIPIALYLILFKFKSILRLKSTILGTMALAPIILTHTITAMCMATLLFVTWGMLTFCRFYYSKVENYVSLSVPIIFTIAMLIWWFYSGNIDQLIDFFSSGFSIDFFLSTPEKVRNYLATAPLGEQLFNNLGMFLFFAFSFIGIFYMISRNGNSSTFVIAWLGMIPLTIGFFPLVFGCSMIEHRWWYFAQILLSISVAIAIYIVGLWKSKRPIYVYGFIFVFVLVLSFLMIMSPYANIDNTTLSPNINWRATPIESELQAQTILDHFNGISKSDRYYAGSLVYFGYKAEPFCENIADQDFIHIKGDLILVRDTILTGPFMVFSKTYKLDYNLCDLMDNMGFCRIYDNGPVYAYL